MATKKVATKKAAPKAASKKTTTAKAKTTKKAAPAKTKKIAAKKTIAKKTVTKKASAKPAAVKKATVKKATKKAAPVKAATAKKATATKKAAAPKAATKKTTAKATKKKATPKKRAPSKAATKKATKRIKALIEAKSRPKPVNVGQAPRSKTVAASIPVPTQIPPKEAVQADAKASKNTEASSSAKSDFKINDKVVYPAHGVGKIIKLEKQLVASISIELFVVDFEHEKMKLRVPTGKAKAAGMRPLSSEKIVKESIATLKGRARIKRTMWSRRAQEYDAKINSGSLKIVAEVVRDLFRAADQPEQSYSERQLFEAALDRMAREVAAVRNVDLGKAIEELDGTLQKKAAAASAAAAATAAAAAAAAAAESDTEAA